MLRLRAQRSILPRSAIETLEHSRPHGGPIGDGVVEIGPLDLSPAPGEEAENGPLGSHRMEG